MVEWSLAPECLALVILAIIALFFFEPKHARTRRRKLFWGCLWVSAGTIAVNIASDYALIFAPDLVILNTMLCTLYFFLSVLMSAAIALYVLDCILEFVSGKDRLLRAFCAFLGVALAVFAALLVWNLTSGALFFIDGAGAYHRGPLNKVGYLFTVAEVVVLAALYARYRRFAGKALSRIMHVAPVAVLLLVAFQVLYPDWLMNGAIAAVSMLIMFVSFQCCRIESDPLTGVGSRKSCIDELRIRTENGQSYQAILVEIRNFSRLNHFFGHAGGDSILRQVADSLRRSNPDGKVFRYSGMGYLVLFCDDVHRLADERVGRTLACMHEEHLVGSAVVPLSCCATSLIFDGQPWAHGGVARYLEYGIALAKSEGVEYVPFDYEAAKRYERREYVERAIEYALENDSLRVWYQPIHCCETGAFDSAEALVRMNDADGVSVPAGEFIPVAEQCGLIDRVSWVVLEQVCAFLGSGRAPGVHAVTINLTARQLLQRDLPNRLIGELSKNGVDPSRLKIEVTERVLAENDAAVRAAMEQMRMRGLRFVLDDFGTGYSNLSNVLNLPFSAVKLDRSLMVGLQTDAKSRLLAETMIPLFHKLGMAVVAEGLETADQVKCVKRYGADRIQGFYYARPMPEEELVAWYAALPEK